jgi:hypothetical protein
MAFALSRTRTFLVFFVFPVQARYFVMILGGMALLSHWEGRGIARWRISVTPFPAICI